MKYLLILIALFTLNASARDPAQVRAFRHTHPCPATHRTTGACPGYVVDHIIALDCGGPDNPSNMQWQDSAAGKAKDRWERCAATCKHRETGAICKGHM